MIPHFTRHSDASQKENGDPDIVALQHIISKLIKKKPLLTIHQVVDACAEECSYNEHMKPHFEEKNLALPDLRAKPAPAQLAICVCDTNFFINIRRPVRICFESFLRHGMP